MSLSPIYWSKVLMVGLITFCLPLISAAQTQKESGEVLQFPSRPLQFVVPYPPGGPLDIMARLLAEKVGPELGQPIIVENRPGAGGNIGAAIVARAKPDGHTLVMGAVAINAINPWLYPNIPFDPLESFEPVVLVASVPNVLILNTQFAEQNAIDSVAELEAHAQHNPGVLNFASGGNGSAGHLAGELFNIRTGINTVHIPYQGAAPAKLALVAGQVDFMFDNLASAAPLIHDGKVKAIAVTSAERTSLFPALPTMQEEGVENFDLGTWFGVFATGGTPKPVVDQLNAAYVKALELPDVRDMLLSMGSDAKPSSAEAFDARVRSDLAKYEELVEISGARLF